MSRNNIEPRLTHIGKPAGDNKLTVIGFIGYGYIYPIVKINKATKPTVYSDKAEDLLLPEHWENLQ